MEIQTYQGEHFERSTSRFVIFFLILSIFMLITIFFSDIFWAVILLLVIGGYFYFLLKIEEKIKISFDENGITFGDITKKYEEFTGFLLEYNQKEKKIQNIVFLSKIGTLIYTVDDDDQHIMEFAQALSQKLPFEEKFQMNMLTKILRKCKI